MKKKIAVFATGWSSEILHDYIKGVCEGFQKISADVYLFMSYPALGNSEEFLRGELNIFNLPRLQDFDVALLLANGLNFPGVIEQISVRCEKEGLPVIYTGHDDGIRYFVGADNYVGAHELAEHLVVEHKVKDAFFIAGCSDNDDSNNRLRALCDVMSSHGLRMTKEQIFYSNWEPNTTKKFLRNWFADGRRLPDAFVCANDELAMVVCAELRRNNIKVPEDVIVTGFDNEYLSSIYDPSISSVNQRFDKIGMASANLAIRLLNGEVCERAQTIACEFYPSESCGCCAAKDFDSIRREIGRNKFVDSLALSFFNRSLAEMERRVLQGRAYADMKENFKIILNNIDNFEGDSFHIVLDPLFEETIVDSNKHLRLEGYPDKMDVILSMDCKKLKTVKDFKTRDIVPYVIDKKKNHFFLCTPLHINGEVMGYAVFADNIERLKDAETLQTYLDRLDNLLSKYKQNLSLDYLNRKLLQLSETDALTHVKNRTAYEAKKVEIDIKLKNHEDYKFAVVLCDINGLKQINDAYGHEAGDEYIINSCKLVCDIFKRSAIYRIGGDEFAIILEGNDFRFRKRLLKELGAKMEKLWIQDIPVTERTSIACGIADYETGTDEDFDAVLHRADIKMYENKQAMKKAVSHQPKMQK